MFWWCGCVGGELEIEVEDVDEAEAARAIVNLWTWGRLGGILERLG